MKNRTLHYLIRFMVGEDAPSEIDLRTRERRSPSDHYPVLVHIKAESAQ